MQMKNVTLWIWFIFVSYKDFSDLCCAECYSSADEMPLEKTSKSKEK